MVMVYRPFIEDYGCLRICFWSSEVPAELVVGSHVWDPGDQ